MYSRRCFVWLKNSLLWKSNFRKCSLTKILIALFSLSSLSFLAYQYLIDHSHVKRHEIPVSTIECRLNPISGGMFSPSDHSSSSNHRIDNKVLVIVETQYSYLGQDIIHLLEAIRVKYKVEPNGKTLPYLTHGNKGKYSAIIFENFDAYVNMDAWNRELLDKYCRDFNVGIISFVESRDNIAYSKRMKDFPLTIYQYMAIKDYELNPMSNIWRITRPGEIIHGPLKEDEWVIFQFEHATYKPLSYAKLSRNYGRYTELSGNTVFPAIQDLGLLDGIQKVIFGNGLRFWLHCLVFLDSLSYLSHGKLSLPLDRYVLIDIDDVFVGAAGKRMKVSDVHALLAAQNRLRSHIKGFYFNLGFSGKYYQKGTPEENLGDRLLVANSDKFWWFGHTWMHTQAHFHENASSLEEDMSLNKEFAQKYNIPVVNHYAVAPHHSGVYPVHEPLYEAWHKVWNITVSSTEEYLHLRPARRGRGFFYRGIKVLPRQTCGLYTHNLLIDKYPGGREKLDASIRGGELFQTFLYNKVNIFMTHMCNYGSDRLALYTFESAVKFLQCWTNLNLQTIPPQELAQVYFSSYPDELNPIWVNPCRDKRHLAIWSARKVCNTLPHLIVIGPQKTGTTAIYTFLNMHPSIRLKVMLQFGNEELLPLVKDTITEVLECLDDYQTTHVATFLQVLHELCSAIRRWFLQGKATDSLEEANNKQEPEVNANSTEGVQWLVDYLTQYDRDKKVSAGDVDESEMKAEDEDVSENPASENNMEIDDSSETIDEKPVSPLHVTVVKDVLTRVKHLMSSTDVHIQLLALDTISAAVQSLQPHEDELLPQVHQLWSPLSQRFSDKKILVRTKALHTLMDISQVCGSFIRKRTVAEVYPTLCRYLSHQAPLSINCSIAYTFTQEYKLQLLMLEYFGKLCQNLGISGKEIESVASSCLFYLSEYQHETLQKAALTTFGILVEIDPDVMWFKLSSVWCPMVYTAKSPLLEDIQFKTKNEKNEYSKNIELLFVSPLLS